MREGKIDVVATRVDELPWDPPAGVFAYRYDAEGNIIGLMCGCPCGCGATHGARFTGPNPWGFDGNLDKPTVTGSFGMYPSYKNQTLREGKYHWHGHLIAGVFKEC